MSEATLPRGLCYIAPNQFHSTTCRVSINAVRSRPTNIHLQFDSIGMLNHSANDSILDFAMVQIHPDFVADLELSIVWLLGWHAMECTPATE
jgi:hypothetical protein